MLDPKKEYKVGDHLTYQEGDGTRYEAVIVEIDDDDPCHPIAAQRKGLGGQHWFTPEGESLANQTELFELED